MPTVEQVQAVGSAVSVVLVVAPDRCSPLPPCTHDAHTHDTLAPVRLQRTNLRGSVPLEARCYSAVFPVPQTHYTTWPTTAAYAGSSADMEVRPCVG
jgi:hypothetical protein